MRKGTGATSKFNPRHFERLAAGLLGRDADLPLHRVAAGIGGASAGRTVGAASNCGAAGRVARLTTCRQFEGVLLKSLLVVPCIVLFAFLLKGT